MKITVETYHLELNESEMYDLIFSISHSLESSTVHCALHNGMATLEYNYGKTLLPMFRDLCMRIGREDLFKSSMKDMENEIMKEKEILEQKRKEHKEKEQKQ